jgi:DNA-binding NarL/FixJ family response regulator
LLSEGRGRILFADDDARVLGPTATALSLHGFTVTAVESGVAALQALELELPDALLLDINMPGNHGLELVQALSERGWLIPVLLLTGYPTLDTAVEAVRLGVVDYITKPYNMSELLERLDLAVHRSRVLRSLDEAESLADELARSLQALTQLKHHSVGRSPAASRSRAAGSVVGDDWARLSAREREVLAELARGRPAPKIAEALALSTNTVRNHLKSIFLKLGVNSQVALLGKLATSERQLAPAARVESAAPGGGMQAATNAIADDE